MKVADIERAYENGWEVEKPKRWRAEEGRPYWIVTASGEVDCRKERHSLSDDSRYHCRNYFKTEIEAQTKADKFKAILKGEANEK